MSAAIGAALGVAFLIVTVFLACDLVDRFTGDE